MVLKSYFDGSNQADGSEYDRISIATVCGTKKEWKKFETDWRKVLYRHHADYLHTTDAVSLQNDFAKENGWTERRVDSFLGDCVTTIGKHMFVPDGVRGRLPRTGLWPITLTIPFDDWLRAKRAVPDLPDTIEEICATESFSFAVRWGGHIEARKYELYFDRGESFYGHIHNRWRHPKARKDIRIMEDVIIVAEAISKDVPALQMADLFAWCVNHAGKERRLWHRRLHSFRWASKLLDYEHLIKPKREALDTIESWSFPPRRSSVKNLSKPKKSL